VFVGMYGCCLLFLLWEGRS